MNPYANSHISIVDIDRERWRIKFWGTDADACAMSDFGHVFQELNGHSVMPSILYVHEDEDFEMVVGWMKVYTELAKLIERPMVDD